jgi:hypothetical protein
VGCDDVDIDGRRKNGCENENSKRTDQDWAFEKHLERNDRLEEESSLVDIGSTRKGDKSCCK